MIKPHVTPATQEDVIELAEKLRPDDIKEIHLASGSTPYDSLTTSLQLSRFTWSIHYKDEVVGMFGIAEHPTDSDTGFPWLLSSEKLDECSLSFIKECPAVIDVMHSLYKTLMSISYEKHVVAHKWLRWCGFEQAGTYTGIGPEKSTFILFTRSKNNV